MSTLASTWVEEPQAENTTNSTNSTPPPSRPNPVWPEDSILEDFIQMARGVSESEDAILIGSILPIAAALLARRVFIRFGSKKYPNLYHLIVTKPGLRKSTTINFADHIAKKLLPPSNFVSGASSEQALFKCYLPNPDKLWIEDEGNTILSNWANDAAGKIVAKRMLKLYDCAGWIQNYIRQEGENDDCKAQQLIPETSTSLLIGTTWNNCRFNGLETRDGMRRRTSYYLGENYARLIDWPGMLDSKEMELLIRRFGKLLKIGGECSLSAEARDLWTKIQKRNRENIGAITQIDAAAEALGSTLAEEPSRILKRSMIFEVCRWAADSSRKWQVIQADTLEMAAAHEAYCIQASRDLETIGARAEIREHADAILSTIHTMKAPDSDGWIMLTRSELVSKFAPHPDRKGAMTPARLYAEILPDLMKRGLARLAEKRGKLEIYGFKAEDA